MSGGMSMFRSELRSAVRDARVTPTMQALPKPGGSSGQPARARVALRPRSRPGKRVVVRLWLPLTPLWLILAPFALLLAPLVMLPRCCRTARRRGPCAPRWPCAPTDGVRRRRRAARPLRNPRRRGHARRAGPHPHLLRRSFAMNEDRKRILAMLGEGKITADEAERLLDAMGERTPSRLQPRVQLAEQRRAEVFPRRGQRQRRHGRPDQGQRAGADAAVARRRAAGRADSAPGPRRGQRRHGAPGHPVRHQQLKPENLEELIEHLAGVTVDVDDPNARRSACTASRPPLQPTGVPS